MPNFEELRQLFHKNIKLIKFQTMLWSVAYSHLSNEEKVKLIKKFYLPTLFQTTFKIAVKYKLIKLLIWLKSQQKEEESFYFQIELTNMPFKQAEAKGIKQADTKSIIDKMQYPKETKDKLEYLVDALDLEIIDASNNLMTIKLPQTSID